MRNTKTILVLGAATTAALIMAMLGLALDGSEAQAASCASGARPAVIAGNFKCLRAGQQCAGRYQAAYRKYGFHCAAGRLRKGTGVAPASSAEPPYTPPVASTPTALDGHYKGVTSQNETFEFDIANGGYTFRGLQTGQINEGCTPQLHLYGGNLNWPNSTASVSSSGDFTLDGTGTYGSDSYWSGGSWHVTIRGHMAGQSGSGSLEVTETLRSNAGISYSCGSGLQTWSVMKVG